MKNFTKSFNLNWATFGRGTNVRLGPNVASSLAVKGGILDADGGELVFDSGRFTEKPVLKKRMEGLIQKHLATNGGELVYHALPTNPELVLVEVLDDEEVIAKKHFEHQYFDRLQFFVEKCRK